MELTNDFRVALPVERAWAVLTDVERIAPCLPGAQLQEVEGDVYRGIVKIKVGPITAQYKGQATFVERDEVAYIAVLRAEGRETRGQGSANATVTATLTPDGDGTAVRVLTDLTITGRVAQFGRGVLADVSANLLDQFVASLEQTVLADEPAAAAGPSRSGDPSPEPMPEAAAEPTPESESAAEPEAAVEPMPEPEAAAVPTSTSTPEPEPEPEPEAAVEPAPEPEAVPEPEPAGTAAEPTPVAAPEAQATPEPERPVIRKIDSPEPTPVDLVGAAGSPVAKRVGPVLAVLAVLWVLKKLLSRNK